MSTSGNPDARLLQTSAVWERWDPRLSLIPLRCRELLPRLPTLPFISSLHTSAFKGDPQQTEQGKPFFSAFLEPSARIPYLLTLWSFWGFEFAATACNTSVACVRFHAQEEQTGPMVPLMGNMLLLTSCCSSQQKNPKRQEIAEHILQGTCLSTEQLWPVQYACRKLEMPIVTLADEDVVCSCLGYVDLPTWKALASSPVWLRALSERHKISEKED